MKGENAVTFPEGVYERIHHYRDEVIRLQEELTSRIALGPQNGGTGEHEKANLLKEKLVELSPDHLEEIQAPDQAAKDGFRPNLVARWNGKKGRGQPLP